MPWEHVWMELEVLRHFQEVAEGATVTDTAARALVAQPALSRALRRLEAEVGAQLLVKVGRNLHLTPAGRTFKQHVDAMLDDADLGLRAVREAVDPDGGVITLGFMHTLGTAVVPALITAFVQRRPKVRFELSQDREDILLEQLLTGRLDLILISRRPDRQVVSSELLYEEPIRLAVPPGHPLAKRATIRLSSLKDEPFVMQKHGHSLRETTDSLCTAAGFMPHITFEGDEVATLAGLVSAGLGVSLLPPPPDPDGGFHEGRFHEGQGLPRYLKVTDVHAVRSIRLAALSSRDLPPATRHFSEDVLDYGRLRREALGAGQRA